jgi:SAM-dependent methyltransferase
VTAALPTSPAADRNKGPILWVLESVLPAEGRVLEIASGTGQHVCFFAGARPNVRWQPTEVESAACDALAARIAELGLGNVEPPVALDVHMEPWPVAASFDAVVCINMIHIAPWSATEALCRGAARHLRANGHLILYGPYRQNGTAVESNLEFHASLRRRNPEWGLRALEDVTRVATDHGFVRSRVVPMPANNLVVIFTKSA